MTNHLPPDASSRPRQRLLRWTQRFLLVAGITALGSAGAIRLRGWIYQCYQTYALRQMLLHQPPSLTGFLTQSLDQFARHPLKSERRPKTSPAHGSSAAAPSSRRQYEERERLLGRPAHHPIQIGSPVGLLEIPRLRVSVVVLEGTDDEILRLGAGHIEQTSLPGEGGNLGIAAHRDTFFRALKDIRENDAIRITTLAGRFEYRVQSTRIVDPNDTWVLRPSSRASLTLVTCYPFYFVGPAPKRFVVRAIQTAAVESDVG